MFKKISNTTLGGILVVLSLVYASLVLLDNTGKSSSVRSTLVAIDTTSVSRILINKQGTETELVKDNGQWMAVLADGKKVETDHGKVMSSLDMLLQAKPSRIVSKSEKKWKDFQVDSTGTQVQVFEGDEKTLDIVLGRFGTKQKPTQGGMPQQFQRNNFTFFSFVRLSGENETYACDDFMGASLPATTSDYRDNSILNFSSADSITAIRFNYPDAGFVLNNIAGDWQIDGEMVDSASIATYLGAIGNATSRNFVDDVELSLLGSPAFNITFESKELASPVELSFFPHPTHEWILHSSQNPKALFASPDLRGKIGVAKNNLLQAGS